eukprot:3610914-Alexandrium_andersonii.AAC.1
MPPAVRCAAAKEAARRAGDLRSAAAARRAMARSERLRLEGVEGSLVGPAALRVATWSSTGGTGDPAGDYVRRVLLRGLRAAAPGPPAGSGGAGGAVLLGGTRCSRKGMRPAAWQAARRA